MPKTIHQSALNMYLRCAEQYNRRYIMGHKIPPGVAAHRGKGFHKSVEINHLQKIDTGHDLPADDLKDAARDEFIRSSQTDGVFIANTKGAEPKAIISEALDQTISAVDLYSTSIAPSLYPIAAELKITRDIGLSMPIEGTLDCVVPGRIRDFKVRGKKSSKNWEHLELQVDFYWELYPGYYNEYPERFQYDEIVTLKTKTDWHDYVTQRDSPERLKRYCSNFILSLQTGLFPPADTQSWMCSPDWCGYWSTCPYMKDVKFYDMGESNV